MHEQLEPAETESRGYNISDLVLLIWGARGWILIPALLGAIAAAGLYVYTGLVSPSTTTYQSAASLTMLSGTPGQYPNGSRYSVTDVRSPAVLADVYSRNQLDRYGMSLDDFSNSIAVSPYSPLKEAIVDRFRARLSNRQITAEERETIETEFRTALDATSREGFLVSFTVPDNLNLPADVGRKAASDVALVWSEIFVDVLGVAGTTVARSGTDLVDDSLLSTLDYPLSYDYLTDSINRLHARLNEISTVPSASSAKLADSTATILDLQRQADNIQTIYFNKVLRPIIDLGLSKNPALTIITYENQISRLKTEEDLMRRRAEIVSEIVSEGATADRVVSGSTPATPNTSPPGSGISIPQFGDSFIDRIVGLSLNGAGVENRQALLAKKLDYSDQAATLAKDREVTKARVTAIRSFNYAEKSQLVAEFTKATEITESELNRIWKSANAILATLDTQSLNNQGRLYTPVPMAGEVIRTNFLLSQYLAVAAVAIVVAFMAAGFVAYLVLRIIRRRTASNYN